MIIFRKLVQRYVHNKLTLKWVDINGTEWDVKDMSTSHIINALNMLKRKGYISHKLHITYLLTTPDDDAMEFCDVLNAPTSIFIDIFTEELKLEN